jgi:hypothetical protein
MAGNVRVRKSWDASGDCCGGAAVATNKKILRGHMIVLLPEIIVPGRGRISKIQSGNIVGGGHETWLSHLHLVTSQA